MNDIKGFLVIPSLVDNRDGITAKFGELSEVSETFSRDRRTFNNATIAPNVALKTFRYVNNVGETINPASDAVMRRLLILGQWIYNQYEATQIPPNIQAAMFEVASTAVSPTESKRKSVIDGVGGMTKI